MGKKKVKKKHLPALPPLLPPLMPPLLPPLMPQTAEQLPGAGAAHPTLDRAALSSSFAPQLVPAASVMNPTAAAFHPLPPRPRQRYPAPAAVRHASLINGSQCGGAFPADQLFRPSEQPRQYRRQYHSGQTPSADTSPAVVEDDAAVNPPPAPSPSESYLNHAKGAPERLSKPRKLLVLLDLNGTLLYRPRIDKANPHQRRRHILRPGAKELISYLFDNHAVMVYTSAMRRNAVVCVDALLKHLTDAQRSQLIGIQPREKLGLSHAQLNAKVQVYKPLEPIWMLRTVQASAKKHGCRSWDVTNTILLDDSAEKARPNPHSLLQVPEFKLNDNKLSSSSGSSTTTTTTKLPPDTIKSEKAIMQRVQARLDQLKWEVSVARRIRVWQQDKTTLVDHPSAAKNAVVGDGHVDDLDHSDDDDNDDGGVSLNSSSASQPPSSASSSSSSLHTDPLVDRFKKLHLARPGLRPP